MAAVAVNEPGGGYWRSDLFTMEDGIEWDTL
jgi:hypothetical protein